MRVVSLLLWSALVAAGTRLLGWWTVPVLGALAPVAAAALGPARAPRLGRSVALGAAVAAALGWGALLAWAAVGPQFGAVAGLVGGLLQAPWPAVVLVTLLLPALLAWSAATLAESALALAHAGQPDAPGPLEPGARREARHDPAAALESRSPAGLG